LSASTIVQSATHLEREVERRERIDAALPQGLPPVDGGGSVMDMEDRIFRMERRDQIGVFGLPADVIAFEHFPKRLRVSCKCDGCHGFSPWIGEKT